eukprot:6470179-Amphidinium_carterae.2
MFVWTAHERFGSEPAFRLNNFWGWFSAFFEMWFDLLIALVCDLISEDDAYDDVNDEDTINT